MASVWIVTTGNSDVKLTSDAGWGDLRRQKNTLLEPCRKSFNTLTEEDNGLFSLSARALGIIHGDAWKSHEQYLRFPLLEQFVKKLKDEGKSPDRIIVLLSNQEDIFLEDSEDPRYDRCEDSPYWRDTCCLEPLFKHYFDREFGQGKAEFIYIRPKIREQGLDNWDSALELIQEQFKNIKIEKDDSVFVSHQAGTPAVSSAVQFASLAQFGDKVSFLIGNERDPNLTKFSPSSAYLHGIRIQEAKALLGEGSYNYAGVEALIGDYIEDRQDIKMLLNAAKNWNVAKFADFRDDLKHHPKFALEAEEREEKSGNWWWIAYEEAYLAVIRENQGNVVEAFFHSFRAFEYIFAAWGKQYFGQNIELISGVPYLKPSALDDGRKYFSSKKCSNVDDLKKIKEKLILLSNKAPEEKIKSDDRVKLDMQTLCKFFKSSRYKEYKKKCGELKIFWDTENDKRNNVSEKRNLVVHQAQGMSKTKLQEFWTTREESELFQEKSWEEKLPIFLNFIVKEDFPEGFATLEEASLMSKVHTELEKAIADL
jgi:predicted transcriptional regulator